MIMKKELILKTLSVSILLTLFGLHVRDSIEKFVSGQMTMALSSVKFPEGVTLPSISFCPGKKVKDDNLEEMLNSTNSNPSKEDYVLWHHAHTYDLNETLIDVIAPFYGEKVLVNGSDLVPTKHDKLGITIREVAIFHGRCYTIDFDWKLKPREYFTLYFNLTVLDDKQMVLFFHERHNEIGLNYGYWPVKPLSVRLRPGDEASLYIKKEFCITHSGEEKCEKEEGYSYPKCVLDWARNSYENSNKTGEKQ